MKSNEQQQQQQPPYRQTVTIKSNTTMSDASLMFEDGNDENNNNNNRGRPPQQQQSRRMSQIKGKRSDINLQHISPIKSDAENQFQFTHSTPNHHLTSSPSSKIRVQSRSPGVETDSVTTEDNIVLPIFKQNRTKFEIPINYEQRRENDAAKKQKLIRELAGNILELNKLRSHSEKLDTQLKLVGNDAKYAKQKLQIQSELDKLKSEMLNRIDVIHELELQLVKIEGAASKLKHGSSLTMQGNNHIMNEIRSMLKEMIHSQSLVNKSTNVDSAIASLTVNEMLEEVEKAATRTATSLLSTIVKPQNLTMMSVSPDLNSGGSSGSSLSSAALSKIDAFKTQLESQNSALKQKLTILEEKLSNFETSNVNLNEIEQLKNLIVRTQRQFEHDKLNLIKEFENERHQASNNNMAAMKKFKDELEAKINEKDFEMKKYLQTLYSIIPQQQQQQSAYPVHGGTVDSSFLTEEEEAIARISERIQMLRAKIDNNNSNKNRSEDSDDTDTKELMQLNEQIRQLKGRMLRKSDQLRRIKTTFVTNNQNQNIMPDNKIYLPIQHLNKRFSSEDNLYLIHQATTVRQRESASDDSENDYDPEKKFVIINRSNTDELSCSPERRYTSSIEIPADQLENVKARPAKQHQPLRRTKSASSSTSSTAMESNLKKHSAKFAPSANSNLISVCLRSLKRPAESDRNTSADQTQLKHNLREAQEEIEKLKNIIEEKNTLINSKHLSNFDKHAHDKEMLYMLQTLENQSKKIIAMKNKIKDLRENGNWNSDTVSSLSDSLERVRNDLIDNLKTVNESDIEETFKKLKNNDDNKRSRKATKVTYKDEQSATKKTKRVVELGVQTDTEEPQQPQQEVFVEEEPIVYYQDEVVTPQQLPPNGLVCNIPEHHDLEDLVHQHREQIANLKILLQQAHADLYAQQMNSRYDMTDDIVDKRAEFDALDLAINNRKRILFELEIRKRRELNGASGTSFLLDDHYVPISEKGVKFLKNEIECLETTLTKRLHEFREVDRDLYEKKQDLMLMKESKKKFERDVNALLKLRRFLNAQTMLFDKKADEATKQLILASDDLKQTNKRKKCLEDDLKKVKKELLTFIELIRGGGGAGLFTDNSNKRIVNSAIFEKLFSIQDNTGDAKFLRENVNLLSSKHKEAQIIEQNIVKQNIELDEMNRIVNKQKAALQSLDNEILTKKSEIDMLRDRGLAYTKEFKDEIEHYEDDIAKLKKQRDELNTDLRRLKQSCDELAIEFKFKNDAVEQKFNDIEQCDKTLQKLEAMKTAELSQLNDIEKLIQEKRNTIGKLEADYEKLGNDIDAAKNEEANLKLTIEQLRKSLAENNVIFTELSENINESKGMVQKLHADKLEYEVRINNLNHNCEKINEEYRIREEQLNELNELNREKENMVKKQEEEIGVLEHEKQNLIQETQLMKDKLKKKKNDLEKFDQANKNMDARLSETQNELRKTMDKLKHSKQELDAIQDVMQQVKSRTDELNKEKAATEKMLNEMNVTIQKKEHEIDELKKSVANAQKQLEAEQKQLNAFQNDNAFEKKTYDAYKQRNKDLNNKIKENEYTTSRFQDLEYQLDDQEKRYEGLKIKLSEKNSEIKYMKDSLARSQNELANLRREFEDLEETFKEREALLENNLKAKIQRLESTQVQLETMKDDYEKRIKSLEENIRDKERIIKNFNSLTSFDSSQIINSSLISYDSNKRNHGKLPSSFKESLEHHSSIAANLLVKDNQNKIDLNDVKPTITNQLIAEEQRKLKEKLQNSISQKANALEKSNIQRKENLDSLKSKLHDIELMSSAQTTS